MSGSAKNFYRLDDVLLRVGMIGLAVVLLAGGLGLLYAMNLAEDPSYPPGYAHQWVGRHTLAYLGLLLCPILTLRFGWKLRQRERRIGAIWQLLRRNAQLHVDELLANSDFSRDDLERAVHLLNNHGLGHYVWDRSMGTIQDGRLREKQLHVEKCEACGGSISLSVPVGFTRVPGCPYCGDPVSVDDLQTRREEVLDQLREEHAPEKKHWRAAATPLSLPLFGLLLLFCWPAALAYAWYKYNGAEVSR